MLSVVCNLLTFSIFVKIYYRYEKVDSFYMEFLCRRL